MKFLLDTDTCIYILKGRPEFVTKLKAHTPNEFAVSAMTKAELFFGALSRYKDAAKRIRDLEAFLEPFAILPFDTDAAGHHATHRVALKSSPIGERDLVIASTALAHRLTVVTHNQREFCRLVKLKTVDWFVETKN